MRNVPGAAFTLSAPILSAIASEWTFHGGRLDQARIAFPYAPEPWIDLSTGISPFAWDVARAGAIDWSALPSPSALAQLEAMAASFYGATPDRICALPGSELGLRLLRALGLPSPHRHVAPGYRSHAAALPESRPIGWDDLAEAVAGEGTVVLANPGNPDGHVLAGREVADLAAVARRVGGWLVVDEAFADISPDASVLPWITADMPVIVLRSFGKFFGLAGIRLGFAIAPADRIAALRALLGGWPVSSAAIAIGAAALSDGDWIAANRRRIIEAACVLDGVLRRYGLTPMGACPLFRLIETDAAVLFHRLAGAGILTRPFDYAPRWLRLGLPPDEAALGRLDRALADG